jgi:hypothetical protein
MDPRPALNPQSHPKNPRLANFLQRRRKFSEGIGKHERKFVYEKSTRAAHNDSVHSNTIGSQNTAAGAAALENNTGNSNIALGNGAGSNLTTGNNNIDIGNPGVAAEGNTIRVGIQGT